MHQLRAPKSMPVYVRERRVFVRVERGLHSVVRNDWEGACSDTSVCEGGNEEIRKKIESE